MPATIDHHERPNWITAKFANLVWKITPRCPEVARLTSEERDRPLSLGARTRLGLHRRYCAWCACYAQQLDLLHEASHAFPEHVDQLSGPSLDPAAKSRMKRALTRSGERPAADPTNPA